MVNGWIEKIGDLRIYHKDKNDPPLKSQPKIIKPFKDSCDHCGTLVDKKYWTFDLKQCVVCGNPECKDKQKAIFRKAIDDIVQGVLDGKIKI